MARPHLRAVALVVVAVLLASACRRKPVATAPPTPPSGTRIALLPDPDDGTVGQATVTTPQGSVDLRAARDATFVIAGQPPSVPAPIEAADVLRLFGDALGVLPPAPRHFVLNFEFNSEELTEDSRRLVPDILQVVKQRPVPDVVAVGHTDTTGNAATNYDLGLRRAALVRNLLVAAGLDPSLIGVTSHGEADLLVQTPDETRESRNRRVEIEVQ